VTVSPTGRAEFACDANEQIKQRQMFHFDSSESRNNAAILRGGFRFVMREDYDPCTRKAQPNQTRLTEESARRRYRRRPPDLRRTRIGHRIFERNERSYQTARRQRTNHVDLLRWRLEIRFLFRILAGVYRVAKRARMTAVKCLGNCLAQGGAL
jgi:hypothetical protein